MTQHMGMMDFSDEDEAEKKEIVCHIKLLPPFDSELGWSTRDIYDGETTLGRKEDPDVTIAHPSVSGMHAAIDVIELPGGGGKRVTLKDLRSMNGTYVVNAETGTSTRIPPKKATMLPVDGCQVQFGSVTCKVVMGPVPAPAPPPALSEPAAAASAATTADDTRADDGSVSIYDVDTQAPGNMVYDVDTQLPSEAPLSGDEEPAAAAGGSDGSSGGGDDNQRDTEPLRDVAPLAPVAEEGQPQEAVEAVVEQGDRSEGVPANGADETQVDQIEGEGAAVDGEEGNGNDNDNDNGDDGDQGNGAGGGKIDGNARGDGDPGTCGVDAYEPPTQCMALESIDTDDEDEEQEKMEVEKGGDGDQADATGQVTHHENTAKVGTAMDTSSATIHAASADNTAGVAATTSAASSSAEPSAYDTRGQKRDGPPFAIAGEGDKDGDETADENDTAELFNTQEEEEMGTTPGTTADASTPHTTANPHIRSDGSSMVAPRGTAETPLRVPMAPQCPVDAGVTSPGGSSDATTQRQESPGYFPLDPVPSTSKGHASSVAMVLDTRDNFDGEGEKAEAGEAKENKRSAEAGDETDGGGGDDPGEDGGSMSSGALIPAGQDLVGFKDQLAPEPMATTENNQAKEENTSSAQQQEVAGRAGDPGEDGSSVSSGALIPAQQDLAGFEDQLAPSPKVTTENNQAKEEDTSPAQQKIATGGAGDPGEDGSSVSSGALIPAGKDLAGFEGQLTSSPKATTENNQAKEEDTSPAQQQKVAGGAGDPGEDGSSVSSGGLIPAGQDLAGFEDQLASKPTAKADNNQAKEEDTSPAQQQKVAGGAGDPGEDGGSVSSGALIPAGQDLAGFEDQLAPEPTVKSDNQANEENTSPAQQQVAADGAGNAGGDAGDDDAGDHSGTETDATEVDTDDGEGAAEKTIHSGHPATATSPGTGSIAPPLDHAVEDGPVAEESTERHQEERTSTPDVVRSPGGTLRRTSTEDAMKAIAREQQRTEAMGAAAASARAGANDMADESGESEEEPHTEIEPPLLPPPLPPAAVAAAKAEEEDDLDDCEEPETAVVPTYAILDSEDMDTEANVGGDRNEVAPPGHDVHEGANTAAITALGTTSLAECPAEDGPEAMDTKETDVGTATTDVATDVDGGGSASAAPAAVDHAGGDASTGAILPSTDAHMTGARESGHKDRVEDGEVSTADAEGEQDRGHEKKDEVEGEGRNEAEMESGEPDRREKVEARERAPSTPKTAVRSSGRRRARPKHFDELSSTPERAPTSAATETAGHDELDEATKQNESVNTAASPRGRKRQRALSSGTSSPVSPAGNASKRGRRSSTTATAAAAVPEEGEAEPASTRKSARKTAAARSSSGRSTPSRTRSRSSRQATAGDGEATDDEAKEEDSARQRGRGDGDSGAAEAAKGGGRGSRKRRADVAAEDLQNEGNTEEVRKSARKRKAGGRGAAGESSDGMDVKDSSKDDDNEDISQQTTKRRRGGSTRSRNSREPVAVVEEPAPATPTVSRRRKGKGKSTPASALAATASPTPTRSSGRGKGRSAAASPMSAAAAGRSASTGSVGVVGENAKDVKVCFTSVAPRKKERDCIKKLGITEVENVLEATHLVAGGEGVPFKRTPKLLAGMGCCRYVLDVAWLHDSAQKRQVLDGLDYILCDSEAEQKYGFNMRTSLGRRDKNGLLAGISVFVDPAVAGVKEMRCPPLSEMEMVVKSAGGTWIKQIPRGGLKDPSSFLVISHPTALAASGAKGTKSRKAAKAGRCEHGYLPEMLFLCILRQKMEWPDDLAVGSDT